MRRIIASIVIKLSLVSHVFFSVAQAQSNEPLDKAHQQLLASKLDEATRWFELSMQDFPKSNGALESQLQVAALLTAKELTFTKLLKLWTEGAKFERVENGDSKMMIEVNYYDDEAKKILEKLRAVAKSTCALSAPLNVSIKLSKLDAGSEAFRERIKKGEWLSISDRKKLENAEWKLNYAGMLKEVLPNFSESEDQLTFDGPVRWEALFHAMATRLLIAQDYYKKEHLLEAAQVCFERAMDLTKGNKYGDIHQKSKDALAKIAASKNKK